MRKLSVVLSGILLVALAGSALAGSQPKFVYIAGSNHIIGNTIDPTTGAIGAQMVNDSSFQPSAIARDPSGKFVYMVNSDEDTIAGYAVDPDTGALTMVPGSPLPAGKPWPDNGDPLPLWWVYVDPLSRFVYALGYGNGLNDGTSCISVYKMDPDTGELTPVAGSPFTTAINPISLTVDPSGKFAYVATHDGLITGYRINASTGALTPIAGSPFNNKAGQTGFHDMTISPSGKFLYTTRFTPDSSVLVFAINQTTGALTAASGSPFKVGTSAASIALHPSGQFAYLSDAQDLVVRTLAVNSTTGALTVKSSASVGVPPPDDYPTFVTLDQSGSFAYTVNYGYSVSGFAINQSTGALTAVPGSPFNSSAELLQMVIIDSAPAHCTPNFTVAPLPNTQSGNFNTTSEVCFDVVSTKPLYFNCSQMSQRTVTVNGTPYQSSACNSSLGKSVKLDAAPDGNYYFDVSAGSPSWASIAFWNGN